MTTDTDPRVAELMALVKRLLDKEDADPLSAYWAIESKITALIAKVPCIASDPRCPCNDGDTCNYVATKMTPAFEVPHPDATQLISIADLLPTLSGADPAMLANVGHYLRGLSDRVKVLPVARTGPLRVAAEAVSAPVEADAWQYSGPATKWEWAPADDGMRKWAQKQPDYKVRALVALATNPPQAEPAGGGAFKIALAVAKLAPSSGRVVIDASALLSLDEELSEKFDEIARVAAELQEVRKDATLVEWLSERSRFATARIDFDTKCTYERHRVTWHIEGVGWIDAEGQSFREAVQAAIHADALEHGEP
jgi:hypothetical protein